MIARGPCSLCVMSRQELKLVVGGASSEGSRRPRRSWTPAEKQALVEMAAEAGSSVTEVAAAFGLAPAQIYAWRKQLANGELDTQETAAAFARVEIEASEEPTPAADGRIVVLFPSGTRMHIDGTVDPLVLGTVLDALAR